jgi:hypothetical protein
MLAFRQTRDLQLAALKDTRPGHGDVLKAAGTFGNRRLSSIEARYETTAEFRHLGESVRFTTLVDYYKWGFSRNRDSVGLEVPTRVWMSTRCLFKQLVKRRGKWSDKCKRNVLAEVGSKHGIEGRWIALVQGHNL